jgi:selenocysteine-specific elongation factor
MKHLILGTAGHIDHGKTSLVKALTGIDTDRLPEEKTRGITIELGFTHLDLAGDIRFGIVDVPGHERFIRTMVAGVAGMDLVMLVIAADEGVMPQTREHLEICQLLGVKTGVVALTKRDLVDEEWLGLVVEDVREYLAGSFLADAAIVPVSSRTGTGVDDLRRELLSLAAAVKVKRRDGPFRLPVDRVFTVAGFGTVVTGTLLSGQIKAGDAAEILPSGIITRVRGIQAHGLKVETGEAGERLAINLHGIEQTRLVRGDVVAPADTFRTTRVVDVRLDCLASASGGLKHRSRLRLHSATYEIPAQVVLFDGSPVEPGTSVYAQLRLQQPALLLPGDPFVLRRHSPSATVGGGRVLDPDPPRRRRRSAEALALLTAIDSGEKAAMVTGMVASTLLTGISHSELVNRTGLTAKRLDSLLAPLLSDGEVVQMVREPRLFLSRAAFTELQELIVTALRIFLRGHPHQAGISKEELKTRLPRQSDPRYFAHSLASLEHAGKVQLERDLVKLRGGERSIGEGENTILHRIEEVLQTGWSEPPTVKEIGTLLGTPEKKVLEHLALLVREGRAVKVKMDLFYHPGAIGELRDRLVAHLEKNREILPREFRELTGLSRKFMIPVLEFFDRQKLTIRVGDTRILRGGAGPART